MRPLDDWMEVQLADVCKAKVEVQLDLPDSVKESMRNEQHMAQSAVFTILKMGPNAHEKTKARIGDTVLLYGIGAVQPMKLPNGRETAVARASDICFIMDKEDLQ